MRTIIAGSRTCFRYRDLLDAIDAAFVCGIQPTTVLSGLALGVDELGIRWAKENHIPLLRFPANWAAEGKVAGFNRNERMAQQADALIAVWHKQSRGTADMIRRARAHGLEVVVWEV